MTDDILRRDPRREQIARNRLHPLHRSMVSNNGEERGPSGLIRRNPHRTGFIGPQGIKRIDRSNLSSQLHQSDRKARTQSVVELPLHRIETPDFFVAVVPDMVGGRLTSHDKDLVGQAHQLVKEQGGAGAVVLILFGETKETSFDTAGADRLWHYSHAVFNDYVPELMIEALVESDSVLSPKYWLFPDSVEGGFDLGCRFSARMGLRPATQVWKASMTEVTSRAANMSLDITQPTPKVLMLMEECALPIDETRHEAIETVFESLPSLDPKIHDLGQVSVDPSVIPLAEAEFILAAGNGVNDWDQFHQAANALKATEGGSRVVVDAGYLPRSRQVGASGTWVTARVYLAVGISGAVQHLQGIGQCDKVIAVNTDVSCDMIKRASLSVIGDSSAILSELIKLADDYRLKEVENAA